MSLLSRIYAACAHLVEAGGTIQILEMTEADHQALLEEIRSPDRRPFVDSSIEHLRTPYGMLELRPGPETMLVWRPKHGRYQVVPWSRTLVPA
jgi:hypothetical protein